MNKIDHRRRFCPKPLENERGLAFVTTILLLIVLTLMVAVSSKWSAQDIRRTANYTKTRAAFYVADSGIQKAINLLNIAKAGGAGLAEAGFDAALASGLNQSFGADWPAAEFQNQCPFPGGAGDGCYDVFISDNDDGDGDMSDDIDDTVILTAVATKDGFTSTIEAVVFQGSYKSEGALVTEKDLTTSGSFDITGSKGDVHSNDDLTINGSGHTISGTADSTGACSGTSCGGSFVPRWDLPVIDPTDFKEYANLIFKTNGEIVHMDPVSSINTVQSPIKTYEKFTDSFGTTCWREKGMAGDCATTWNALNQPCGGGFCIGDISQTGNNEWRINGTSVPQNVMIYVEMQSATIGGRIKINGVPSPWTASVISTGYIDVTAGGVMQNYMDPNQSEGIQNILFIAGTDLKTKGGFDIGTAASPTQGFFAVRDQIDLGGNVFLKGWVNATDVEVSPSSQTDGLIDANKVSGDMHLDYDGLIETPFPGPVRILTWRELAVVS